MAWWGSARRVSEGGEDLVDLGWVEGLGVEAAADPLQQLLMPLVLGVGDRVEDVGVASRPADILRRAGPAPGQADRSRYSHSLALRGRSR